MINIVSLMGRLTAAPELKKTQSGKSVVSVTLAVDRRYQQQGEEKKADFIPCIAWGKTAEFLSHWFNKGDMLAVTGEIQTRNYEDRNGNKRSAVEVIIDNASFCGSKKSEATAAPSYEPAPQQTFETLGDDEDLPF